ncbi:MAG: hypothetical protein M0Z75_14790 [Nitrospiraceae bacterium]|nr:hypothetical protein [Nitrospiraceae bacterium]
MKGIFSCLAVLALLLSGSFAYAVSTPFSSGSTGADGAFSPTSSVQLQIPPNGVFNFTTVNIPSGVTVTFAKNTVNTPVYVLATGDVNIAGTIDVSGGNAIALMPGPGGPGGFDGGYGGGSGTGGKGLGPGGGVPGIPNSAECEPGAPGGYGTSTGGYGCTGVVYGNIQIIPFIGGSGGGGGSYSNNDAGAGGGGGGGAILIASSGTINITGSILANGGQGAYCSAAPYCDSGGNGSGGAIKLMANTISGNGSISAVGASGNYNNIGGYGRIRLEANQITRTALSSPVYTFIVEPGPVFVSNIPSLQITSIAGQPVQNPSGSYGTPDITLPAGTTNPVQVGISAANIPTGTVITVSVVPQLGAASNYSSTGLAGTLQSSTATASVTLSLTVPCVLMAQTTFNIQTAMNYNGEKIKSVVVASKMGGGSQVTYITASGKKIPAEKLFASLNWKK